MSPTMPQTHPSETAFRDRIGMIRNTDFSADCHGGRQLAGELHCDLDPVEGHTVLEIQSGPGEIGNIETMIDGLPRWVVLRLELAQAQFRPGDVLGVVARGSGDATWRVNVLLRMVRDGVLADTRFDDALSFSPKDGVSVALHTLSALDPAVGEPGACALILALPVESCRVSLQDLEFFVIPAESGLRSVPMNLGSYAA